MSISFTVRQFGATSKRQKFYAAFNKFAYQNRELDHLLNCFGSDEERELSESATEIRILRHFLGLIKRYDFWKLHGWLALEHTYNLIEFTEQLLQRVESGASINDLVPDNFFAKDRISEADPIL